MNMATAEGVPNIKSVIAYLGATEQHTPLRAADLALSFAQKMLRSIRGMQRTMDSNVPFRRLPVILWNFGMGTLISYVYCMYR